LAFRFKRAHPLLLASEKRRNEQETDSKEAGTYHP
jgi:hypothetical protein